MSDTMWYERTQGMTANVATNHREPWSVEEIDTVLEFTTTDTDADIALALGRTLKSIQDIQWRLRREGVDTVRAAYAPRVVRTCPTHHLALTATGDCDWC